MKDIIGDQKIEYNLDNHNCIYTINNINYIYLNNTIYILFKKPLWG